MSTITGGQRAPARPDEGQHALHPAWERRVTVPLSPSLPSTAPAARPTGSLSAAARPFSPVLGAWLFLYVLLNAGDLVSTYLGLHAGLHEANPLMSGLLVMHGFGALIAYKLAVIFAVIGGAIMLHRMHPRAAFITVHICNLLVFLAVALNVAQMVLR